MSAFEGTADMADGRTGHVRYWHLADIGLCAAHVRFWTQSGHLVRDEKTVHEGQKSFAIGM